MQKINLLVLMTSLSLHGAGAAEMPHYSALPPGRVQIGSLFGANHFQAMGVIKPSAGGEFLLGLPHNFAAYGDGGWDRAFGFHATDHDGSWESQGIDARTASASVNLYQFGGGLQWSIPNRSRIVPYVRGGLSCVHLTASAKVGAQSWSGYGNRLAGTFGGGARLHISRSFGVLADVRAYYGIDMPWLVRVSSGFFYQFK